MPKYREEGRYSPNSVIVHGNGEKEKRLGRFTSAERPWTVEEDNLLLELVFAGKPWDSIQQQLHRSEHSVKTRKRKLYTAYIDWRNPNKKQVWYEYQPSMRTDRSGTPWDRYDIEVMETGARDLDYAATLMSRSLPSVRKDIEGMLKRHYVGKTLFERGKDLRPKQLPNETRDEYRLRWIGYALPK